MVFVICFGALTNLHKRVRDPGVPKFVAQPSLVLQRAHGPFTKVWSSDWAVKQTKTRFVPETLWSPTAEIMVVLQFQNPHKRFSSLPQPLATIDGSNAPITDQVTTHRCPIILKPCQSGASHGRAAHGPRRAFKCKTPVDHPKS